MRPSSATLPTACWWSRVRGSTESAALTHAVEQLTHVGVPLLGVVLNDIDFKRDVGYDSSYRAYASNRYLSASQESR